MIILIKFIYFNDYLIDFVGSGVRSVSIALGSGKSEDSNSGVTIERWRIGEPALVCRPHTLLLCPLQTQQRGPDPTLCPWGHLHTGR